ncbi:MAG: hypothetical protein IE931_14270 [Sphingobacteriales bacterium]|nr:hypothetical protein [Sphingobacteriales bacterium]
MNKDYIAQNLCINKDKPWLRCNGKCFLMKKIAEADKKQQSQEKQIQKDLYQQMMLVPVLKFQFFKTSKVQIFPYYADEKINLSQTPIFHPPISLI